MCVALLIPLHLTDTLCAANVLLPRNIRVHKFQASYCVSNKYTPYSRLLILIKLSVGFLKKPSLVLNVVCLGLASSKSYR